MISAYRAILTAPGAVGFTSAGFTARLAHLTTVLGTVFLVSSRTGSYGSAGLASAGYAVAYSLVAPFLSRRADRHRQGRVLVAAACATAISRCGFLVAVWLGAPAWSLVARAAASGASMPAVGPFVRARWNHLLPNAAQRHTAASFESVLDEILLVIGPIVVSTLVAYVNPAAGLMLAVPLAVAGLLALAWQGSTQPSATPGGRGSRGSALTAPGFPVLLTFVLISSAMTIIDLGVVAFSQDHHATPLSGWILATLAVGSASSGLWYGARDWQSPPHRRLVVVLPILTAGMVPFVAAPTISLLFPAAFILGLAMAPALIAGYSIISRIVPPHNLTEGLTRMTTASGIGISAGSALGGAAADSWGTRAVFTVATGCAAVAMLTGLAAARTLRQAELRCPPKAQTCTVGV